MIEFDGLAAYCLARPGAYQDYPFDDVTWTARVGGKMFALATRDAQPLRVTLKCDPDYALALRAAYPSITPGYHMSKRHWNTVILDGSVEDTLIRELIDHSYGLVFNSLTKKKQAEINGG